MQTGAEKAVEHRSRRSGLQRWRISDRCSHGARANASPARSQSPVAAASRALSHGAKSRWGWRGAGSREFVDESPYVPHRPAILIIEANDEFALALEEALEGAQFNVESVASVGGAKLFIGSQQFDLVVLNWATYRRAHAEAHDLIRSLALRNGSDRLPVIATTSGPSDGAMNQNARRLGVAALADKSRPLAELVDTVRAVLGMRADRMS